MRKSLFIGLVAVLGLISCSRNQEIDVPDANLSLFARTESPADTKTVVESGVHVYWEPGDEIVVFTGEQSAKFTTDITAASGNATFKGTFGDATWPEDLDLWAVYPFSEDAVFDGETITTVLPSEQVAREGSFGKDMNLAIAHSNSSTLQFYNVGGGIRFSVTEEGIRKVMFEGLSGEIISGKIKIGLDESGEPIVQEVTGGSQFITLLPPSGQETFEPGAWYYIVAIPGSLEGGYKLRFYKDSDYARRVSEKAVQIKRSIYGNIEKADEGIEYEATTTHFPETKEEWETSIELTNSISNSVNNLIASMQDEQSDEFVNVNGFVTQVLNIEGVSDAFTVGDNIGAVIIQENGVHINVVLNHSDDDEEESDLNTSSAPIMKSMRKSVPTPSLSSKQALLITPYYSTSNGLFRQIWVDVNSFFNDLQAIGYTPHWAPDEDATVRVFSPATLSQYDLVIIATHGNYEGFKDQEGNDVGTILMTGSEVGSIDWDSPSYKKLAAFITTGKAKKVDRYAVSVPWFEGVEDAYGVCASFNGTLVMAMACDSYHKDDLASFFTSRNSPFFYGNKTSVKTANMGGVSGFVKYLCMGMSAQNAVETMREYDFVYQKGDSFPGKIDDPQGPIYLIDPTPSNLHNSEIRDAKTTLIWEQAKTIGDYRFKVHLKWPNSNTYTTYNATTSKAYTTDLLQPGEYTWYVEANLYYDGKVIETFTSETKNFTVTEEIHYETPQAIDLGLPSGTKWASFNLGATKPEEYGYYYAWGETEPKATYSWSNYMWCKGTDHTLTKYCTDSSSGYEGFVDNKTKLDLSDDAARVNLQGYFRTPTCDEMKELFENSSVEWTNSYHGTGEAGYILTSNVPGYTNNSIFLPFAGDSRGNQGRIGNYMMSETNGCVPQGFNSMYLTSDIISGGGYMNMIHVGSKAEGTTIRPVYPTQVKQITIVPTQTSGYVGNQIVLSTETVPVNASHNYVWSSSNESIAKVFSTRENTCRINLVSPGVATITVTALDGNVSASCQVIVKEEEPKAIINISPTEINYGDVKVGEGLGHETGRVTFTNTGNADLSIFFIDCPDGFSHSTGYTFPIVISPGNDKTIVFAFKPTEVKTYSGYIQVYTNASNGGGTIKVTGNGIE